MAIDRYTRCPVLSFGTQYGTSQAHTTIRSAIKSGQLPYKELVLRGVDRLDTLAGTLYGDASYWWILAAASGIGWNLQVPPGTVIKVPDLKATLALVG